MSATNANDAEPPIELSSAILNGNSEQRMADRLVKMYGDSAAAIALDRADALYELGNVMGSRVWIRVLEIIEDCQRGGARAAHVPA